MQRSEIMQDANLPGYDALQDARFMADHVSVIDVIEPEKARRYKGGNAHWAYLKNPALRDYLGMPKIIDDGESVTRLAQYADALSQETLPRFLDASGWAYAEAGLTDTESSTVERMAMVHQAEAMWEKALVHYDTLDKSEFAHQFREDSMPYRLALNLAYSPLIKALITGNVTSAVRERVFADSLAIGQIVAVQRHLAQKENDHFAAADFTGLLHENNALLSLLYLDDPRYIPLPSSAKADNGYYNRDQTHDIVVINQHWGHIKKVIPVEIKASADLSARRRYKSLIIRGKMHLVPSGSHDPLTTLNAFGDVFEHSTNVTSQRTVEYASLTVQHLLTLYQQGVSNESIATDGLRSLTKFHDVSEVEAVYPELSRQPRYQKKSGHHANTHTE